MMICRWRRLNSTIWLLLTILLTGCAAPSLPPGADSTTWPTRQATLAALTDWRAAGRIGVISGPDGWHAHFQWQQHDSAYRIDLSGPLGQGRVTVQGGPDQVSVQTQDGQHWNAPDAEALLEQSLGTRLPVTGLRYWIRGLPQPDAAIAQQQTDSQGRLIRLEQSGWIIEYSSYTPVGTLQLPERITAYRPDLSIKLLIEQWTL